MARRIVKEHGDRVLRDALGLKGWVQKHLVARYRQLRIADVLPDAPSSDSVVVPMRKPGRPGAKNG